MRVHLALIVVPKGFGQNIALLTIFFSWGLFFIALAESCYDFIMSKGL